MSCKESGYKILPKTENGPVGYYYADIDWKGEYSGWEIVRIFTPPDGSCLFHAILNGFSTSYHSGMLNGKQINKEKMVSLFRKELAEKLAETIPGESHTYYESLNNGNMKEFSEAVPEFSLKNMQAELNSNNSIGYGYLEFISDIIEKDIYILDADRQDIYISDEAAVKGDRSSIVIYYSDFTGHYELIAIKTEDSFASHFSPKHSFIKFLYEKIQACKSIEEENGDLRTPPIVPVEENEVLSAETGLDVEENGGLSAETVLDTETK